MAEQRRFQPDLLEGQSSTTLLQELSTAADSLNEILQRISMNNENTTFNYDKYYSSKKGAVDLTSKENVDFPALSKSLYKMRRSRDRHISCDIFGEPAWDILLDLYTQQSAGKRVSVSSACIGAAVPPTTALRWLSALEQQDLIVRATDNVDKRRAYIDLSPLGKSKIEEILFDIAKILVS